MSPAYARKKRKQLRVDKLAADLSVVFRAQPGPQEAFLAADQDIVIYGGAAGGGKTFGLLLDILHSKDDGNFGAVIFRRDGTDIFKEGGIWDESENVFPHFNAVGRRHRKQWVFPSGARLTFAHLEHEKTRFKYQGAQIQYIGFEELTHFTEKQFWYMLSRNRSSSGGRCYIRATCNPDCDSFVAKLVAWYVDQKTGYAIKARSGVTRWFVRVGDTIEWASSRQELVRRFGEDKRPRSFTFIMSDVHDNPALLKKNPEYLAALESLSTVDRERLLKGNWKIRPAAGLMFRKEWFGEPLEGVGQVRFDRVLRYWDLAATKPSDSNPEPAYTVGVKLGIDRDRTIYILDVRRFRDDPGTVATTIKSVAAQDGRRCEIYIEEDPGQAGKMETYFYVKELQGYAVQAIKVSKNKVVRANPASAQCKNGSVRVMARAWLDDFMNELENFPDGKFKDQVDSFSGAMGQIMSQGTFQHEEVDPADHTKREDEPSATQQLAQRVRFKRGVVAV